MTDSILRSYYNVSSSTFVPFAVEAPPAVASDLLSGETNGFAIDAATTFGGTLAVIDVGTPANNLSDVSLDASNLVNSSTSPKMVHHFGSPYVRWSAHNLFLNSGSPATQNVTLVTGFVYTYGITGTGSLAGTSGASGTATAGSPVTFTASGTTGTFTVTGSPTTMWINSGAIQVPYLATTGAIRIGVPQTYDAAAAQYGVWVESAGTNLCFRSEELNNAAWTNIQSSISANSTTAPDGTSNADTLVEDSTAAAAHYMGQFTTISFTSGTVYTLSVYAKASTRTILCLQLNSDAFGSTTRAWYNLTNGTVGSTLNSPTTAITAVGNGWYRCAITKTATASNPDLTYFVLADVDNNISYNGNGTSGLYLWGAQVEASPFATSYVPTLVTATATRAADAGISALTSTYPHSATVGTIAVQFKKQTANATQADRIIRLSDGTDNEVIQAHTITTDTPDSFGLEVDDGGAPQVVPTTTKTGSASASAGNAIAFRWKANDFAILADGGAEVVDTSGTLPTVTSLRLGYSEVTAVRELQGYIYKMIYVPDDRTQAEMQTLMDRF